MKVKDIMTKNILVCKPDDTLSHIISEMKARKIHQVPVVENGTLKGTLLLNNIIKSDADPTQTKVKAVMIPTPKIGSDATIEEAAELILGSNMRAVPVFDRALAGIVSETDIMKAIKLDGRASDLSKECSSAEKRDAVGKIKKLFVKENISRIPVVDAGKCIGVVGTLELIDVLTASKQSSSGGGFGLKNVGYKETRNINETAVETIMRKPVLVRGDDKLSKVVSLLEKNEEVFVENGTLGIITPKDIMRTLLKPKETTYFQISGLGDEDSMTVAKMHKIIGDSLKKIAKAVQIQPLHIFVEYHKKQGIKTKYSIKLQLPTQLGTFIVTKVWGYNLITATQEAIDNLERQFWKKYETTVGKDKASRRAGRGK